MKYFLKDPQDSFYWPLIIESWEIQTSNMPIATIKKFNFVRWKDWLFVAKEDCLPQSVLSFNFIRQSEVNFPISFSWQLCQIITTSIIIHFLYIGKFRKFRKKLRKINYVVWCFTIGSFKTYLLWNMTHKRSAFKTISQWLIRIKNVITILNSEENNNNN